MANARGLLHVAAFITLAACGAAQTAPPPRQSSSADGWNLTFRLTGGFAGVDKALDLASSGALTARDRRRGANVSDRIPSNDVARITALLADLKAVGAGGRSACRDCLEYDVEIQTPGRSLAFHLDDTTLAASGIEPLVQTLTNVLDSALAGRLAPAREPG